MLFVFFLGLFLGSVLTSGAILALLYWIRDEPLIGDEDDFV